MMDADLQKVYRDGILAAVAPIIQEYPGTLKVLSDHLDLSLPDADGLRAVAGAAWDEAIEAKYQQTISGSPDSLPNPYRDGTP